MKEIQPSKWWQFREKRIRRHSPYVHPKNPVLRQIATEVPLNEVTSDDIQARIYRLLRIAEGETGRPLAGLADPQVAKKGVARRIIVVNDNPLNPRGGKFIAIVNPRIVASSSTDSEAVDGCFSVDNQVLGKFPRPDWVSVTGYDRNGNEINPPLVFEGYDARVPLHEIDHLDGKTFINHLESHRQGYWRRRSDMSLLASTGGIDKWQIRLTTRELRRLRKGKKAKTVFERIFALIPFSEYGRYVRRLSH